MTSIPLQTTAIECYHTKCKPADDRWYMTFNSFISSPWPGFYKNHLSSIFTARVFPHEGRMSSLGTAKGILEIAKFGLYVTIPVALMYAFASNSDNLKRVMANRAYVVYPPEGPRPPSPEEVREMRERVREMRRKNGNS